MASSPARVLLLGGSSFVGTQVMSHPRWPVAHWTFLTRRPAFDGGIRLDLLDKMAVEGVIRELDPTHILDASLPERDNPGSTRRAINNVVQALRATRPDARYLLLSSDAVFSGDGRRPYREDDPVNPCSRYGLARAAAELVVAKYLPNHCLVRTCLVYGPDAHLPLRNTARVSRLLIRLARDDVVPQYADQYRTPTYAVDLADALIALLRTDIRGVVHAAGPQRCSRAEFARAVARAFGFDPARVVDERSPPCPPYGRDTSLDSSLLAGVLGWSPRTLESGLAETVRHWTGYLS